MKNCFAHMSQTNGCSPVCWRLCSVTERNRENPRPQTSQWKGRSPVCVRLCSAYSFPRTNDFPQWSQMWITRSLPVKDSSGLGALLVLPVCTGCSTSFSASFDRCSSVRQLGFDSSDKNCSPSSTPAQLATISSVLMLEVTAIGLQFDSESGRSSQVNGCTSQSTSCFEEFVKLTSSKCTLRDGCSLINKDVLSAVVQGGRGTGEVTFKAFWYV